MPLITLCGFPSSGKTVLAARLKEFFENHLSTDLKAFKSVQLVNEEYLKIPSNDYFFNTNEEKKVRAALLATSERLISKDTLLILDSLNYIKGFRYQLYCQARAVSTPHLVIHCQAREETCRLWNRNQNRLRPYPTDQLDDLILRFETPNNQNKWDCPLFGIITEDYSDRDFEEFVLSLIPILTSTPNRPPSTSTLTTKPTNSNTIQILDYETQLILDILIKHQQDQMPLVKFPNTPKTLSLPRPVTVATLSRIRRQFLHLNKLHPTVDPEKIRNLFIDFLAANIYL